MGEPVKISRRQTLGAGLLLAAASAAPAIAKSAKPIRYIDGLSFLPDNLDVVADSSIGAMISTLR